MKIIKYLSFIVLIFMATGTHAQSADTTISFTVQGNCVQCKNRIENALKIPGVNNADWNIATKLATVNYNTDKISPEQLHHAVASAGHSTDKEKAPEEVYLALPDCCHYLDGQQGESITDTSENIFKGVILENKNGKMHPLEGASVFWADRNEGTTTNLHGEFALHRNGGNKIVVSYAGFRSDTVSIADLKNVQITLDRKNKLENIIIVARPRTSYVDGVSASLTSVIDKGELLKAACCSLSESFETNPSVDVSYSDAITGSKQIQLLGLAGIYTQLTVENLPGPRGIATPLGLNSIAGPWIEKIFLIKGTGSVANGFESIAGQINVELKKPRESEKLYLNGYLNDMGKADMNLVWSKKLNDKWATGFLLHDDFLYNKADDNGDGFRDLPTGNLFSGVHRWDYMGDKGLIAHFGVKVLLDDRTGGSVNFGPGDKLTTNHYGLGMNTQRYEAFVKTGYIFPEKQYKSIALQFSAFDHTEDNYFGLRKYDAHQKNLYANFLYQSQIGSEIHKFKTGLSFNLDDVHEVLSTESFDRKEITPGAFVEYTFSPNKKFDLVAGMRADHNNLYGWFGTPRLNVRYEPVKNTTIRFSIGRGQRTANIFAENIGVFVSSREWEIKKSDPGGAYGLQPEVAWNKGISVNQKFRMFDRNASFGIDFFRNDFVNQVIVDVEDIRKVRFYNLEGKSYSNSLQAELDFSPAEKLDVRMAYRYFSVMTDYNGQLLEKPFTAKHRAFANLAYEVDGWKFDYTINLIGKKRIPSTGGNPIPLQMETSSPAYITMNAQVSRHIGKSKKFELYAGAENLTNYFQKRVIIAADEPFGPFFDATMIWGPVSGRLVYGGFRYTLK